MQKKAFIFDMDGTLLDSMPVWRSEDGHVLEDFGYVIDDDLRAKLPYMSSHATSKLLESAGICSFDTAFNRFLELMEVNYVTKVQPKAGAHEFLDYLKTQGIRCFVASATPSRLVKQALALHGLLDYFEDIFDDNTFGIKKANPEFFYRLAEHIGLACTDCVMFEDSRYAMESANQAGLTVYAIEDSVSQRIPGEKEKIIALSDVYVKRFDTLIV